MSKNNPGGGKERGVIINVASVVAYDGQIGQVAYASSKAAVVGMTLPVARELGQYGIRCVAIAPGVLTSAIYSICSQLVKTFGVFFYFNIATITSSNYAYC